MSNLSRRSLVSSAAALPALAIPAIAADVGNSDAELLALGIQLEVIIRDWVGQMTIDRVRLNAWEEACTATGLPYVDPDSFSDDDAWREYLKKRESVPRPYADEDEDKEHDEKLWKSLFDRVDSVNDKIFSHQPQTLAGLAVQVRAITLHWAEMWGDEFDTGDSRRMFIESFCVFVGVKPVPDEVEVTPFYEKESVAT
jgi:hypothetical protein